MSEEKTIAMLQQVQLILDELDGGSQFVSRYFNNESFAFRNQIVENEIARIRKENSSKK